MGFTQFIQKYKGFFIIAFLLVVGVTVYFAVKLSSGGGYDNCPDKKEKLCNGKSVCHTCSNDFNCEENKCNCEDSTEKEGAINISDKGVWGGKQQCCTNTNIPKNGPKNIPVDGVCCNKNMLLDNGYCCPMGQTRDETGSKCVLYCGASGIICDENQICSTINVNEKNYNTITTQLNKIPNSKYHPTEYPTGVDSVDLNFCSNRSSKSCIGEESSIPSNFASPSGYSTLPRNFLNNGEYSVYDGQNPTSTFTKTRSLVDYNGDNSILESLRNWKSYDNKTGQYRGICCVDDCSISEDHLNIIPYKNNESCSMTKEEAGLDCVSRGVDSPDYANVSERWWAENKDGGSDTLGWCILQRKLDSDDLLKCKELSSKNYIVDNTDEIYNTGGVRYTCQSNPIGVPKVGVCVQSVDGIHTSLSDCNNDTKCPTIGYKCDGISPECVQVNVKPDDLSQLIDVFVNKSDCKCNNCKCAYVLPDEVPVQDKCVAGYSPKCDDRIPYSYCSCVKD
jgi:hypothetical protein